VLKRTLGVPLFQEQAMQIAITAAKFTPDEADGLRRAMATFRHNGTVHLFEDKFINGMVNRGYDRAFAENCFEPDQGLRRIRFSRKPRGEFCAARLCLGLDQMPLSGRVLRRHPQQPADGLLSAGAAGARCAPARCVEIRAVDVNFSDWDCTLEPGEDERHAVRLGFRLIHGLGEDEVKKLVRRPRQRFSSIERLAAIAGISRFTVERLAEADAFRSLGLRSARRAMGGAAARHDRRASDAPAGRRSD
jgi:error-prone DNA polymerase